MAAPKAPGTITIGTAGVVGIYYSAGSAVCRVANPTLKQNDVERLRGYRYTMLSIEAGVFKEYTEKRHTTNPLVAASWGVGETRDLIVQFYLTLKRMLQRSVEPDELAPGNPRA